MELYRMFATEYNHRSCVRVFKREQLDRSVIEFMRKYCAESYKGTVVELIQYKSGKPMKRVLCVEKPC